MSLTLADIFNEYKNIMESSSNQDLSPMHTQGALAYLEIKAQAAGIVFLAPELVRASKNYKAPALASGKLLAEGKLDDLMDSSEEVEDLDNPTTDTKDDWYGIEESSETEETA